MATCKGTKTNGEPCTRSAGAYGYCYQHDPLTDKQRRFIDEYMMDLNATAAAKRAGYSEKTAYSIGHENLRKPEIREAVDARLAEAAMSADEAIARLTRMARGDISPFAGTAFGEDGKLHFTVDLTSPEAKAHYHLIKKLKFNTAGLPEIELHDAKDALVQLLKLHGAFVDKVEHSGPDGGPLQVDRTPEERRQRIQELQAILRAARGEHGD